LAAGVADDMTRSRHILTALRVPEIATVVSGDVVDH
jgi:hypothetical protein